MFDGENSAISKRSLTLKRQYDPDHYELYELCCKEHGSNFPLTNFLSFARFLHFSLVWDLRALIRIACMVEIKNQRFDVERQHDA